MNPNNRMYVSNEEMLRLGEIMEYKIGRASCRERV